MRKWVVVADTNVFVGALLIPTKPRGQGVKLTDMAWFSPSQTP